MAERDDRGDDRPRVDRLAEPLDEALVDLDPVDLEVAQVTERRVAGAKVVERDTKAFLTQALQRAPYQFVLVENDALCHFELYLVRADTGAADDPAGDRKSTRLNSSHVKISY